MRDKVKLEKYADKLENDPGDSHESPSFDSPDFIVLTKDNPGSFSKKQLEELDELSKRFEMMNWEDDEDDEDDE